MTRDSGDQPTRLTVAELLAQHGKPAGGTRHRHRRRADDDASDAESDVTTTAPQAIIERIKSETPDFDWQPKRRNGHSHGVPDAGVEESESRPARPAATNGHSASGYNHAVPPRVRARPWQPAPSEPSGSPVAARLEGLTEQPVEPVTPPPPPPPQRRSRRPMRPVEPQTDQFAAVEAEESPMAPESSPYVWHGVAGRNAVRSDLEDSNEDLDLALSDIDRPDDADFADYDPSEDLDLDELVEDDRTPGQQWLAVGAQLALGVVGGAAVWLTFNWLWMGIPALALAAALIVIAGLVWIVRKIRKAEDLQSTVLAVLVGLVVTVSPAALLLLSK